MTAADELCGYLFAYFTGDTLEGEAIRFALSDGNDALRWRALAGGRAVLRSVTGTGGVRDPFIVRLQDDAGFVLLATDLSIGGGTTWVDSVRAGSRAIEVWRSDDLLSWSRQEHVTIAPRGAGNAWAPEAIFDPTLGRYLVYWASQLSDPSLPAPRWADRQVMMACTTRDFSQFSEPFVWLDPGWPVLDSTVVAVEGAFHRFTKDEGGATGCADILHERSSELTGPWEFMGGCIARGAGLGSVEGPIAILANPGDVNGPGAFLFVDEYAGEGYRPLITDDITLPRWRVPDSWRLPPNARHGSVIPINAEEMRRLESLRR